MILQNLNVFLVHPDAMGGNDAAIEYSEAGKQFRRRHVAFCHRIVHFLLRFRNVDEQWRVIFHRDPVRGDQRVVWPAALASTACFLLNAGLLRYLYFLDRERR